ncbi:MAG: hypothetical protein ACNS62_07495 [Candidatus Cyclobacteriaceae bacterium M3_2C_046]
MFVPLDNREFKEYDFQKMKARRAMSWLRLYAIHYFDQYVITGGAIKLTLKMEYREHTRKELKKLETVKNILKFNQGEDLFVYLNP